MHIKIQLRVSLMLSLKFFPELYQKVVTGKKTQTRRLIKTRGSSPLYRAGTTVNAINTANQASVPIQIGQVWQQHVFNINTAELIAEGFPYQTDRRLHALGFVRLFCTIYGIDCYLNNPLVWVIDFNLIVPPTPKPSGCNKSSANAGHGGQPF